MKSGWFHRLQRVGKALMVPVAVLPVAGLLVGLGTSPIPFIPDLLGDLLLYCGAAVFSLLPLMFAIAVALTFSHQDGTAALAATTGYASMLAAMAVLAMHFGWPTRDVLGFETLDTGVLGGVLMGLVTGAVYRRFHQVRLPEFLAFFSGRRLVPLVNVLAGMVLAVLLASLWPLLALGLDRFSEWAIYQQPILAWGLYGAVERLLIPLGLHHIWNLTFFYELGSYSTAGGYLVQGEVGRFLAGDPNAGHLAGGYLIKMFGLPAAALAIWRCAEPAQRAQTGGIMLSAAVTSALTGVTEPIEFAFLFIAPGLFLLHALLTGLAYMIAVQLAVHHGMVFSQGLIDFSLYFHLADNLVQLVWLGPLFAGLYYLVFTLAIRHFNLPTPGRHRHRARRVRQRTAPALLAALGGAENLNDLDACLTRLRLSVYDPDKVDEAALKRLGAKAVIRHGLGVQVVVGPQAEGLKSALQQALGH
ncbi:PTS system D-glucose-specific IIC and IIB components, Glc family [Ferrimonas balearica DSM 9799]|uniref:PTS system D-glucose-specific IIC and IIB components, Glc family n=1 Tax=Ferrimonas balearica (strain DSM 9799 / CCM 4581 / KCTC 23876 / PAT) TaxID=550540 RepID=E1SU09_FERBD|nr:PTS transporter subunit EIIC [Ferrimonas balearica]ADN75156.1 PTS system D-glucose-specific IIC and IIB components, Glc family [Ferrimonas balearica DSM 9799]MBW3138052.1 PTS transporter subunit EIIC [Ferrimonas balearica]MBW3164381.1 PTS transporter subunit EIIC [Ferrimonas balearica]MBY6105130.1 PTS transporter subunit EIIC [Ferrimonas balearica]